MKKQYDTFDSFYKNYFLIGHQHKHTKLFHFLAIGLAILFGVFFLVTLKFWFLVMAVFTGYSLSIVSHYLFEKNEPAAFKDPWKAKLSDWIMFLDILRGKVKIF